MTTRTQKRGAGIKPSTTTKRKASPPPPPSQEKSVPTDSRLKLTNDKVGDLRIYKQLLKDWGDDLCDLLPAGKSPTQFRRMALNCWTTTPQLKDAARITVLNALAISAQLGLYPNGVGGEAWVACYNAHWLPDGVKEATVIVGYQGAIKLMMNHPSVVAIDAKCVCENDDFKWAGGSDGYVEHSFPLTGDRGKPVGAYAMGYLAGAPKPVTVVMTQAEIEKRRTHDSFVWEDWTEIAYMKTAVFQLAKLLPKSGSMALAVEIESRREQGKPTIDLGPLQDGDHSKTYSRTDELANQLDANQ